MNNNNSRRKTPNPKGNTAFDSAERTSAANLVGNKIKPVFFDRAFKGEL